MNNRAISICLAIVGAMSFPAAALADYSLEDSPLFTDSATTALMAAAGTPPAIPATGDRWDGVTTIQPSKLVQKDGVNYYEITKCAELAYVAQTGGEWLSRNYLLANNLILNDVLLEWDAEGNLKNDPATLHEWTPIGTSNSSSFRGIFDGGGYTVSGVYINQIYEVGIGFFSDIYSGGVKNLTVVNSCVCGQFNVGGIAGTGSPSNCVFSGLVKSCNNDGRGCRAGGITGYGAPNNCVNYGIVTGISYALGGITGIGENNVYNCVNYGMVKGDGEVGGIAGYDIGGIYNCVNYGTVTGIGNEVGGIAGASYRISSCSNFGTVTGNSNVGGIVGEGSGSNCYNIASVTGSSNVGGIVGGTENATITNCYNIGTVLCTDGESSGGAIVGSDGAVWNKDTITGCYYLKTNTVNAELYGCGGVVSQELEPYGFYARDEAEMKMQSTYEGWAFDTTFDQWGRIENEKTWAILPSRNGGYPYLVMETSGELPSDSQNVAASPTALALGVASVSVFADDTYYLSLTTTPVYTDLSGLTWRSSNPAVATVDANGKITGIATGNAVITAECGAVSVSCAVTVTARNDSEYRLNSLTLRDSAGAPLSAIPNGPFFATVSATRLRDTGNAEICLASYSRAGQFRGVFYAAAEDMPVGSSFRFTFPIDNTDGRIGELRVFVVPSFTNPVPIGAALRVPE